MLSDKDQKWVEQQRRKGPLMLAISLFLILGGGGYGIWGAQKFQEGRPGTGFDRPIARLDGLLDPIRESLNSMEVETEREKALRDELLEHVNIEASLLLVLLRVLLSAFVLSAGLVFLAVYATQRRWLTLVTTED